MEETEILKEEKTEEEEQHENDELIEAVREKHGKEKKTEHITDIFIIQLIFTVALVLVFAVINIFDRSITQWFINEFKERSMGETEKIIKDAVSYAVNIIR